MHGSIARRALGGLLGATVPLRPAGAQPRDFPRQPIRIIVPFAAGAGSDTVARLVAKGMQDALGGHAVVVENRVGGGGITGTEQGARAAPDGHTLTMGTTSSLAANPALNPRAGYRVERDFTAVAAFARSYYAIVTANTPEAPKSLAELVARLRGADGHYGSGGVGTIGHLASVLFLREAGAAAQHVSYRGTAAVFADVATARVMFATDTLAGTMPFIQSGQVRPLAVTAPRRVATLPEVPTTTEAGFPRLLVDAWFGLAAPVATPGPIVDLLSAAALRGADTAEMRARFAALELEPMLLGPAPFTALMRDTARFWGDFIRQSGITLAD